MSLVPTLYSSLPPVLRNLFNEIICAPGQSEMANILREAINVLNPDNAPVMTRDDFIKSNANGSAANTQYSNDNLFLGACYDFVNYQINDEHTCNKDYNLFMSEGFQIGSPWHGDIIQAPVMFLSVNPAITQNCVFPRWHSEDDSFTLAGSDAANNINYNGITASNKLNSPDDVYNFLRDRLRTAQTNAAGSSFFWTAELPAKTTAASHYQQYWRCALRNVMNAFHPIHQALMNSSILKD